MAPMTGTVDGPERFVGLVARRLVPPAPEFWSLWIQRLTLDRGETGSPWPRRHASRFASALTACVERPQTLATGVGATT